MFNPYDPTDEFASDGGERRISDDDIPEDPMIPVDMNVSIAEDKSQIYEGVQVSRMSMKVTRSRVIYPEYDLSEVEQLIREFFERFPTDVSLVEQSALWVRFFAGFHFFQDANHRTGINTLEVALFQSDIDSPFTGERYDERTRVAREKSKDVRDVGSVDKSQMFEKDELYKVWGDYFDDVFSP
jgi:hypothetical protein